jgi:hypothetical protein
MRFFGFKSNFKFELSTKPFLMYFFGARQFRQLAISSKS